MEIDRYTAPHLASPMTPMRALLHLRTHMPEFRTLFFFICLSDVGQRERLTSVAIDINIAIDLLELETLS